MAHIEMAYSWNFDNLVKSCVVFICLVCFAAPAIHSIPPVRRLQYIREKVMAPHDRPHTKLPPTSQLRAFIITSQTKFENVH